MLKKLFTILVAVLFIVILFSCGEKKDEPQVTEEQQKELRAAATGFMKSLKGVLVNQIKENGIVAAVSVCSDTAQKLTNNYADENNIYLKRVSFKYRNNKDKPDEYETEVLNHMAELENKGKLDKNFEYVAVETIDGEKVIHYMMPIFVGDECLPCHGNKEQIPEEIKQILNEKYPEDKATGYEPGDLRGAVSIKKKI